MKVFIDNREMSIVRLLKKMSECEVVKSYW
jgi:hypothetical protein